MTKRDLVVRIADETGLIQQDVYGVIQRTLNYIMESLAKGDTVELRNFGVFEVRERKQRIGRNPNKPENVVTIPPRKVVKFKPGKIMKQLVTERSIMELTEIPEASFEADSAIQPARPATTPSDSSAGGDDL